MRGGEGFARSIGSGLDKLADGLGKFLEKRREEGKLEVANGKAALATLKASPSLQKSLNLTPEQAELLSHKERSAAIYGGLAGMKQEEGFRAGQAQTAKILADALTQRQEAEGNTAFDLAQGRAYDKTFATALNQRQGPIRPQPVDVQGAAQQILQTPGAARSRAGIQLLEAAAREREQQMGGNVMPVPATIGGRNLIVNPKSGAFQDVTPQSSSAIPKDFVALGATMDESGKLDIRYGPPKAEGKALSQTEVAGIAALNQAEMDLNTLENTYKQLGENYGGPVSARVKSLAMGGQNPNIAALENAITAATPNLARGVFREVGVLTDQDVARYKQLLPAPTDTQEVRTRKIKQLRDRIAQGRKEMVTSLEAAGRDVQGFSKGAGGGVPRFDSEDAARAANVGTNVFEMYDPATATYRKARLK